MSMDITKMDLTRLGKMLKEKEVSAKEMTQAFLDVATARKDTTHGYVEILSEKALREAEASDARRREGLLRSSYDGIPIALKDNMMTRGTRTTAGSAILKDHVATYDATVTKRLRDAGMIILGKTNCDEYAMGSSTESSCHGPTRNPWDTSRVPGGSSGGSAVVVAEGSAPVSFGSDTGGSIRQPASLCGVVGLKPTYGRVSRYGLIALASSLDQIGPFARTVDDAAAMLSLVEGEDARDATSVPLKEEWKLKRKWPRSLKGTRIGLPKEYFVSGMDPKVESVIRAGITKLEGLGAELIEVSLPHADYALAVYYILMPSEASANLARFDGIRYGTRVQGRDLEETYRKSREAGFGDETRRRIMIGTYALSSGYYDAYYLKALKVRRLISNDYAKVFEKVDCLITPTSPTTAWKLGEKLDDPLTMYLSDIYTVSVNVAGLPGISVPCGLADGLPVGLQMIGRHFDEDTLLGIAHAYEQVSGWHDVTMPEL